MFFDFLFSTIELICVQCTSFRDAILVAFTNCATSVFAAIIIFAIMGFKVRTNFEFTEQTLSCILVFYCSWQHCQIKFCKSKLSFFLWRPTMPMRHVCWSMATQLLCVVYKSSWRNLQVEQDWLSFYSQVIKYFFITN